MTARRTLQALERVQQAHPLAKSGYLHVRGEVLESGQRLYCRLCQLRGPELEAAILGLTALQARLLCHVIGVRLFEEHAIGLLSALAAGQPTAIDPSVAVQGWLLASDGGAFVAYVDAWRRTNVHDIKAWDQLVRTASAGGIPPMLLLRDQYLNSAGGWTSFQWAQELERQQWIPSIHCLQRLLLLGPVLGRTAHSEPPDTILRWAERSFVPSERDKWLATFIDTTLGQGWGRRHAILELIHSKFGPPKGHSFWAAVSAAGVERFTRWLVEHELTSLLGEGPRVEFWRRFIGDKMEVPFLSRDGDAVLLLFPGCIAVQFIDMGKATFLVPRTQVGQLRRLDAQQLYGHVRALHNMSLTLGRYEHRGYHWEHQAERIVRQVLGGGS